MPKDRHWYYVDQGGERRGPTAEDDLVERFRSGGLHLETHVWCDGMAAWSPASKTDPFRNIVATDAMHGTPQRPPPTPRVHPAHPEGQQAHVDNNLTKAILSTIFCCLPLGIVAIVKASQVNGLAQAGQVQRARETAQSANTWANWSIFIGVVVIGLYFILSVIGAGL